MNEDESMSIIRVNALVADMPGMNGLCCFKIAQKNIIGRRTFMVTNCAVVSIDLNVVMRREHTPFRLDPEENPYPSPKNLE
jgi:hypothetical protein